MTEVITTTAERPDLVPIVAGWLWHEFWHWDGHTLQQTTAVVAASVTAKTLPRTFVLLLDGKPVGTASLSASDLAERPNLTPWLAGVYVVPEARGRGFAARLVATVEDACRSLGIPVAWLYTSTAERLYARAGWLEVETVQRPGKPAVTLMRRDLPAT